MDDFGLRATLSSEAAATLLTILAILFACFIILWSMIECFLLDTLEADFLGF